MSGEWTEQRSLENGTWQNWRESSAKCALALHSCISVMDNVKINE